MTTTETYIRDRSIDEIQDRKFASLGKELFHMGKRHETDFNLYLKRKSKFFEFNLPDDISEFFIGYGSAPLFWVLKSRVFNKIDDFLKFQTPINKTSDNYSHVLKYYLKWVQHKLKEEKKYFANTTINYLTKYQSKYNFFYLILHAVILTFDESLYDPKKAENLFRKARETVENLKFNLHFRGELYYFIDIYSGFCDLKQKQFDKAIEKFKRANTDRPFGINAKYYLALSYANIGEYQSALLILKELYNYDEYRVGHAIEITNDLMFDYFIENAIIYDIFDSHEFAPLTEELATFIKAVKYKGGGEKYLTHIKNGLEKFSTLFHLYDYFTDESIRNISFLGKVLELNTRMKNQLFLLVAEKLNNKLTYTIDIIINEIKQKYYNQNSNILEQYDEEIKQNEAKIKRLKTELEEFNKRIRTTSEKMIASIEKNRSSDIAILELALKKLNSNGQTEQKKTFGNYMSYTMIVTALVFVVGCISSYLQDAKNSTEFGSFLASVIISGIKWGSIAFVIGSVISILSSVSAWLERSNKIKTINIRINELRKIKIKEIEAVKSDADEKLKSLLKNYNRRVEETKKRVESLRKERTVPEAELKVAAEKFIQEESKELLEIIS